MRYETISPLFTFPVISEPILRDKMSFRYMASGTYTDYTLNKESKDEISDEEAFTFAFHYLLLVRSSRYLKNKRISVLNYPQKIIPDLTYDNHLLGLRQWSDP